MTAPEPQRGALSPGQHERWLAASFDEGALRALDETFSLELRGALDRDALQAALQFVCGRHPAFTLALAEDAPQQYLEPSALPRLQVIDLDREAAPDDALRAAQEAAAAQRFALGRAPMIALSLFWLSPQRAVLHLIASHLVFDGWAASVFVSELAQAYQARLRGAEPQLPPAESPIAFAQAETERMAGPEGAAALAYWTQLLRDPPPALNLGDRVAPARRSFTADTLQQRFDGALFLGLKATAKRERCTLFQLLLATTAVALRQLSGQSDFVLSLPYASQALGRHPALLADGVLDLPIRLKVASTDTALSLLPQVRQVLMDALEQPLITQGQLARALKLPPLGNRPPLTGVFFNLNPRIDLSGFAPLEAALREGRKPGLLGELIFNFYDEGDAIALDLHHSPEFFSPARIARIAATLETALRAVAGLSVVEPEPGTFAFGALTPIAETACSSAPPSHVLDLIRPQIAAGPLREALRFAGRSRSYAELGARVDAIAEALRAAGIGPGDSVGLYLKRGLDLPAAMLGVFATGAAYVPLDPAFPRGRLKHMAEDAALRVLLCDEPAAVPSELSDSRHCLALDAIAAAPNHSTFPTAHTGEAAAYVLYTSGSTGKPKGVQVRQRNVASFLAAMQQTPGLGPDDRLLAVTTPSFDISVLELLLPLTVGACCVIASEDEAKNPALLWPLLRSERCTHLQTTPSVLQMWLSDGDLADLAGRTVLLGGEGLPAALASSLLPTVRALWNMYGPTETTVWSSCWRVEQPERGILIGAPIAGTTFYLLDPDLRPVPVGAEGELCIGGLGVAAGYLNRPELNADRFVHVAGIEGALYRTGDLAVQEAPGRIRHLGRLDAQIKLRGYRIELGEIESVLLEQAEVQQAAAVVREDRPGDQRLVAYVVLRAGAALDEAGLRARCAYALAEYMVPQHVLALDALPRLPNGKTDRKALPAPTLVSAAGRAPADALEAEVSAAMATLLGLPEVGMEQSFFALGGHSLLAIQLVTRLNKSTGAGLKMRDIFEQASAEKVAALIRGQRDGSVERSELVQIPHRAEQSQAPQSVMQQRLFQLSELSPGRNVYNMPSAHRLRGPLDRDRLLQALSAFVQRQPALRTRLLRSGEGLIQQVLERVEVELPPTIDLSALAPAARQAALDARIDALIELPIALDHAPQWRLALFKLSADEHVLFLMAHHAIWDGWSFDVFYQEMAQLYPQPDAQLPALPLSYVDFAAWHLDWLRGTEYQRQLDYWRQQLAGRRYSALPGDFARGAQMSGASQTLISDLPAELSARLQARAREWDATLYMLLLAAYAVSIERCMGLTQQLIGTPVRGRNHPDLEGIVGYFVNLVALPLQVDPTQDLRALVAEIKPRSIGAFANADVQLDDLLGLIRLDTGDRSARLYQASFSFQDVRARPGQWGALEHSRYETRSPGVTEDLAMFFVETSDGLHAILSYNSALFSASTMEAFRATLLGVLDALAEGSAGRIDALPVQRPASALAPAATDEFATPLPTSAAAAAPPEQALAARAPGQPAEFEQLLITLWSELLPEVEIDPDATLFDLGGHSLLALSMVNRVEALCGRRLSLLRVGQTSLRGLALDLARGEPTLDHPNTARPARLSWLRRLLGRPA